MRTHTLSALGATALLALALAGCAPTDAPTTTDGTSADDTTSEETETEGAMLVLPGTGEYVTGDTIPIGGYQLSGEPESQPEGCTWTLYEEGGELLEENNGSYVFITDVTGKFVTSGCPDWEQFE